jgi:ABC-2 type transport system permease protein
MMLRSVFLKTFRDQRVAIIAWGGGLGLLVVATAVGYLETYPQLDARRELARQIEGGLSITQVFYGEPHRIETLAGFVEWRGLGLAPVLLGLFMVFAATGVTRGAEQGGRLETVVAAHGSRGGVFLEQLGALAVALAASCLLLGLLLLAAAPLAGEAMFPPLRVAGSVLNAGLAAAMFGAFGVVAAQLTTSRRSAALAAGGLMAVAHLWNGLALITEGFGGVRAVSPIYLYAQSTPLSGGGMGWLAVGAMAGITFALTAVAAGLALSRDFFGVSPLPWVRRGPGPMPPNRAGPSIVRLPHPRTGFGRGLRDAFGTTLAWSVSLGLFALVFTAAVPNVREALLENSDSAIFRRLEEAGLVTEAGILSITVFGFIPLLVAGCAVSLAAAWEREETSGRLELELACPPGRRQIYVQRLAAAVASALAVLSGVWLGMLLGREIGGVDVGVTRTALATLALLPLAAAVTAAGFAMAAWRPGAAAGVTGALVAVSFFWALVLPLLGAPDALRKLSVFAIYGQPIAHGVEWPNWVVLTGIACVFAAAGAVRFERRDITR